VGFDRDLWRDTTIEAEESEDSVSSISPSVSLVDEMLSVITPEIKLMSCFSSIGRRDSRDEVTNNADCGQDECATTP
jgi:hypothetical protein